MPLLTRLTAITRLTWLPWAAQPADEDDPATTVDVELLDADGLVLRDADGKTLLAADQVYGLAGGEWLQTSDGQIFGVSPA